MRTGSAPWWCTHLLRCGGVVWHREREREGKWCDEEEMGGGSVEVGEMSDWCGTACALQQHPAAHGMPARCAVGDGHLAALPAWLLYMAALLPSPCFPSPPHDMVVVKEEGEGGSHVPPER